MIPVNRRPTSHSRGQFDCVLLEILFPIMWETICGGLISAANQISQTNVNFTSHD